MPCPADISELGHSTWTFLHSMAAYYPSEPTPEQQELMRKVIQGVGAFYPCPTCAAHMRAQLRITPPDVSSSAALSRWFCDLHNEVNGRLGREKFDCSRVMERWKTGPGDGSCDAGH